MPTHGRGYLVDLDGTLISGDAPLPGAQWLVRELGSRIVVVSNNAEHTPEELSRGLTRMGLPLAPERLVLAGSAAIDVIAGRFPGARIALLASPALKRYARKRGLDLAENDCDIVLVGRDRRFSYERLAMAAREVAGGAQLWLACPDTSHRGPGGEPVPETGALGAAVQSASGARRVQIVGKPESLLFELGCARLNLDPSETVMIGDNRDTDGAGSIKLGMRYLHVAPGDLGPGLLNPVSGQG